MRLITNSNNGSLQGYTTVQSGQAGWLEFTCTKNVTTGYSTVATARIDIASGNPNMTLSVIWTWTNPANSNYATWFWGELYGFRCNTNSTPDNPTGNGAVGGTRYIEHYYNGGNNDLLTPSISYATRQITFNSRTGNMAVLWTHHFRVFSPRIDLITISCV